MRTAAGGHATARQGETPTPTKHQVNLKVAARPPTAADLRPEEVSGDEAVEAPQQRLAALPLPQRALRQEDEAGARAPHGPPRRNEVLQGLDLKGGAGKGGRLSASAHRSKSGDRGRRQGGEVGWGVGISAGAGTQGE